MTLTKPIIYVIPDRLLPTFDLLGTFLFAMEGAATAIQAGLDLFGVLVISFTTAFGGGMIRDVLIGETPPAALTHRRYGITAFSGGTIVLLLHEFIIHLASPVVVGLDAAGLALFALAGAAKALDRGIDPFIAVLLGTITGVGGGTLRDIFLARIPAVLRVDIYAVAALLGSAIMVIGVSRGLPRTWMMVVGGLFCFLLRIVSVWQHWNLPHVSEQ